MPWCLKCGNTDCETDHATRREAAIAMAKGLVSASLGPPEEQPPQDDE